MINAINSIKGTAWFYVAIVMCILLFVICFICVYNTMSFIKQYSIVQRAIGGIYSKTSKSSKERAKRQEQERMLNGYTDKVLYIEKIDKMIMYSGIKNKIKWINTEIVIYAMFAIASISMIFVTVSSKNIVYGIETAVLVFVGIYAALLIADNIQYRKVESTLTEFLGVVQNFSSTSNDIISIFQRSIPYLREPIKSAVIDCVNTARNNGNITEAMTRLEDSIEHKHFKMIIKNLETCTRHGAGYSDIIDESKVILDSELKFESKVRAKYNNGRIEVAGLIIIGIIGMNILKGGLDTEQTSILRVIANSKYAQVAFLYWACTIIYLVYNYFIRPYRH